MVKINFFLYSKIWTNVLNLATVNTVDARISSAGLTAVVTAVTLDLTTKRPA